MKIFLLFFILFPSWASLATERLNSTIINEYLKIQKEFSDFACRPGTEDTFRQLDKNYRGNGNFIPVLLDESIDLKTIKNILPLIQEKNIWIQTQIDNLSTVEGSKLNAFELDRIQNEINLITEAKKEYFFASSEVKKKNIQDKAVLQFEQLVRELEFLKNKFPFLLSFKFPINHLALRSEYEKNKSLNSKEGRGRANSVYFYRRVVQDGAFDEDLSRNDSVVRASFDTLYLSLNKDIKRNFLTENERVDLQYIVTHFKKLLSIGPKNLISRFLEWKARNERSLAFYQMLLDGKKIKMTENSQIQDLAALLEDRSRSLYTLKDFVLSKEARTYEFWARRSDLYQALFAIETILYNEVGLIDAPDALERRDVTQVVINRSENPAYNRFSKSDSLIKYFAPEIKMNENKWLNVLFKEGEFSFTYFHIPGNLRIYCPDMSRTGRFLRKENIRIALSLLNNPRTDFKAIRYFSRLSMFGRIEMDSLWQDFLPLEEVPGKPARNAKKIYEYFKQDRYRFLYHFNNEGLGKNFVAIELKGRNYVLEADNPRQIFYYRNPNQFKYFIERK